MACPDTKLNWLTAVSKRPSYQHANRDHHEGETDDQFLFIHGADAYLFGRIGTVLEQLREKPPHFCEDFFSLIYVWSGGRDSNSRHSAWKADALPTELPPLIEFNVFHNTVIIQLNNCRGVNDNNICVGCEDTI